MSLKHSYPLNQQPNGDIGRWRDPVMLYQNGRSRQNDTSSDESENNALSDSTLDGFDLGSSSHSRSMVNSMMYSDDDLSAKSGYTSSEWLGTHARVDDPLSFHSLPLFTNADMLQVSQQSQVARIRNLDLQRATGSICDTSKSSLASSVHDNYFKPSDADLVVGNETTLLKSLVTDTSTDSDSEHYIFTDDEDDDNCKLVPSGSIEATPVAPSMDDTANVSPSREQDWSSFHQRRGRLLAQQLLENVSNRTRTNTANSSSCSTGSFADRDDCEDESDDSSLTGRRTSFFARAVNSIRKRVTNRKKAFSLSSSPIDKMRARRNWTRLEDSSSTKPSTRPATPQAPPTVTTSAASTRNYLSDFSSWETCVHTERNRSLLSTLAEDDTEDCSSIFEETSFSSEARDDPFLPRQMSSCTRNSFDRREDIDYLTGNDEMIVFRDAVEDRRTSSEEIAAALGIEREGTHLLRKTRALSRTDTNFSEKENVLLADDETLIPMVKMSNDVWLSKYDEYVSRTVSAFYSRLPNVLGQHVTLLLDD